MKFEIKKTHIINVSLLLVTVLITIKFALWISEAYFFDKFYYYKSLKHGYWIHDKRLSLEDFDERAEDIRKLTNFSLNYDSKKGIDEKHGGRINRTRVGFTHMKARNSQDSRSCPGNLRPGGKQ